MSSLQAFQSRESFFLNNFCKNLKVIKILIVILQYINKIVMGITKSDKFTDEQNRLAGIAKTLGHPARLAILQQLFKMDSCICGDLVDEIGLAQPTISQHLKELKNLGIIKGNISGTSVCYCIDQDEWAKITTLLTQFLSQKTDSAGNCC